MEVGVVASQQLPVGATIHALRVPSLYVPFQHILLHPGDIVPALAAAVLPTMSVVVAPPAPPHMPGKPDDHFVPFPQ